MSSNILKEKLDSKQYEKLKRIDNPQLHEFIAKYIELCNPGKVFVCTDAEEDIKYIREISVKNGEEIPLAAPNHTIHFDSYFDQARDKQNTKILLSEGIQLDKAINTASRKECLLEIHDIMKNIMKVLIVFYSTYGHVYRMAEAVAEGAKEIKGADVALRRVPETL